MHGPHFCGPTGVRFLNRVALSEAEVQACEQHPSTFFGVTDLNAGPQPVKAPIDYFTFLWESMSSTPKAKLMELMKHFPDKQELAGMSQYDLATLYCVGMA